jgi:hypothetical protein
MINRHLAAERSAETNRSGPLRRIVGAEPSGWGTYFEALECGHKAWQHSRIENVQFWVDSGQRRRCTICGRRTTQAEAAGGPTS